MNSIQRVRGHGPTHRLGLTMLLWFQWIALASWLGGMLFLSFIGAPSAFKILQDANLAGEVVGIMLDRFYLMSYGLGAILVLSTAIQGVVGVLKPTRVAGMITTIMIMVGITGFSREVVTPQINQLRQGVERMDMVPSQDPRRITFNRLHQRSVQLLGSSIILGMILIYLAMGTTLDGRNANKWRL